MGATPPSPRFNIRQLAPWFALAVALVLSLTVVPALFGTPSGQPVDATATAAAVQTATASPVATPAPETDTSLRTQLWNQLLVHPLERGLTFLAADLRLGAGLAIILFTIVIRIVLFPLTLQQIRSQKAMQRLQPELKALQKKYGGDREKISAETMALYKAHGVNPAMGCLPLLLQMPVLFGLYAALSNLGANDPVFQESWLWLENLHKPDVIQVGSITLPFILPILAAGTQWVQQKMMTPSSDDPQQKMQNQMMQFMPLMMLWFGLSFSAGLALYWVTQNLVGIVQQYFTTGWGSLRPDRAAIVSASDRRAQVDPTPHGVPGRGSRPADTTGAHDASRGGRRGGGAGGRSKKEGRRASGKR